MSYHNRIIVGETEVGVFVGGLDGVSEEDLEPLPCPGIRLPPGIVLAYVGEHVGPVIGKGVDLRLQHEAPVGHAVIVIRQSFHVPGEVLGVMRRWIDEDLAPQVFEHEAPGSARDFGRVGNALELDT